MNEICVACLCRDRYLYYLEATSLGNIYVEIINEIGVCDLSPICMKVCWECRAILRRFNLFKDKVKSSYSLLVQYLRNPDEKKLNWESSSLSIAPISTTSHPHVKTEDIFHVDEQTTSQLDGCFETQVKIEVDDTHYEPETFVHELPISFEADDLKNQKRSRSTKEDVLHNEDLLVAVPTKSKKKRKSKTKVKMKKRKLSLSDTSDMGVDCDDGSVVMETEDIKEDEDMKLKCKLCDVKCIGQSELDLHMKTVHTKIKPIKVVVVEPMRRVRKAIPLPSTVPAEKPQCLECGKTFSSRKTYRYHFNVLHKGLNRYPCPRCGKVYQWKSNLGRHMRSHKARDSGELYCDLCDKRFASVATYRQHLKISRQHVTENEYMFMCNDCGKKFVSKTRLRDHIDWDHLKKIKYRCHLCNKPFKCYASLYLHVQNVHRNKELKENLCHVCGKSYQNAGKLKYHIIAMHTGETPYKCEHCDTAFGWYSSLHRHVREVHYKMRLQPKKAKKPKKISNETLPALTINPLNPHPSLRDLTTH